MSIISDVRSINQYSGLVELHSGPLSVVWSAVDERGQPVVLKAYQKGRMKPRHIRNVIREKRVLQVFNEHRQVHVDVCLQGFL